MVWRKWIAAAVALATVAWTGFTIVGHHQKVEARELLDRRFSFQHEFRSYDEALTELARVSGVRVIVAPEARDIVNRTMTFAVRLRDVRFVTALRTVLAERTPSSRESALCYYVGADGAVRVTTARSQAARAVDRRYDLSHLVWGPLPVTDVTDLTLLERREQIDQLIQETVEPETWRDAGGLCGAVRWEGDTLIVTQTPELHEQVSNLLTSVQNAPIGEVGRLHRRLFGPCDGGPDDAPTPPIFLAYRDALRHRTLFLDP